MHRASILLASILLAGCGSSASPSASNDVSSSTADLCSAAPIDNGDGTATMVGCSYEQHTYNITHHGQQLASPILVQGKANITHTCGRWLYGKDPSGVSIIVDRDTGEVQSHGMMHGGMPVSGVTQLTAPVTVQR
ncbi:MAG: hypothetical protein ACXWUG_28910 [Polyangiales bacterium]